MITIKTPKQKWGLLLLLSLPGLAQTIKSERFDAASIKPYVRDPAMTTMWAPFTGGVGSNDPGHVSYGQVTLRTLVADAYGLKNVYDISGPAVIDDVYWAVTATYPPSTTMSQYREMVKALLEERFHLKAHVQQQPLSGLEMTVAAGGLKLSPSASGDSFAVPVPGRIHDIDGFPLLRPDLSFAMTTGGDAVKMSFRQVTLSFVASRLSELVSARRGILQSPTVSAVFLDKTGLKDKFNIHLEVPGTTDLGVSAASISQSLEKQLGIHVNTTQSTINRVVIDQIDKTPTPN